MLLPLATPFAAGGGQRVEEARSRLLWDADFRSLPRQVLPATQAEWRALAAGSYGAASTAPALSHLWRFDQAAGDALDTIGGKDLANNNVRVGRPIVGLHKGAVGQRWHRGAEWSDGENTSFTAGSTLTFDPQLASFGVLVVLRAGATPSSDGTLIGKQQASGPGWALDRSSSGDYTFTVLDSGGVLGVQISVGSHPRDSAPHFIFARINRADGEAQAFSDFAAYSAAGLGGAGNVTSSVAMTVGGPTAGRYLNTTIAWQCAWVGIFLGADAEAVTATHLERFWQHGRVPAGLTMAAAGERLTEIEDDPAFGVRLAGWAAHQLPLERATVFPGMGLGLSAHGEVANLIADSSLASWADNDCDILPHVAEAPNGLTEAVELVATASPGWVETTAALTAGDRVQFAVYCQQPVGADSVYLEIYNAAGTVQKVSQTLTPGPRWERLSIGGGWIADATATFRFRVRLETVGQSFYVWGAQVRVGDYPGPLVWSEGAPTTLAPTDLRVTGAASEVLRAEEGELVAEYACATASQATHRFVVDCSNTGSDINRRFVRVASGGTAGGIYDAGGFNQGAASVSAAAQSTLQTAHKRAEFAWAASRVLAAPDHRARMRVDGEAEAGGAAGAIAHSATVTTAWLGQDQDGDHQLAGVLRRVRCYGAAPP